MGINVALRISDGTLRAETEAEVRKFMAEHGWTFANGRDLDQGIVREFKVAATPTTFLITPNGEILGAHVGAFREDQLLDALQTLLNFKGS